MTLRTVPAAAIATPDALIRALQWRYAVKKFDPARRIPEATWNALEQSLVLSPSSFGLQPWRFVVISDPALRAKLREASWNQSQTVDASHFVALAARVGLDLAEVQRYTERIAAVRGQSLASLEAYRGMMAGTVTRMGPAVDGWTARQTYIALGNLLTSAAVLGIDACPMEGVDPARYDELLGLTPLGYRTQCAVALGYRAADDAHALHAKVRYPAEELILRR
jgi:nitroreductase